MAAGPDTYCKTLSVECEAYYSSEKTTASGDDRHVRRCFWDASTFSCRGMPRMNLADCVR